MPLWARSSVWDVGVKLGGWGKGWVSCERLVAVDRTHSAGWGGPVGRKHEKHDLYGRVFRVLLGEEGHRTR